MDVVIKSPEKFSLSIMFESIYEKNRGLLLRVQKNVVKENRLNHFMKRYATLCRTTKIIPK